MHFKIHKDTQKLETIIKFSTISFCHLFLLTVVCVCSSVPNKKPMRITTILHQICRIVCDVRCGLNK